MAIEPTTIQPPIRSMSVLGVDVYGHTGEFSPSAVDLIVKGRGLNLRIARKYRAAHYDRVGPFGRGWQFNYGDRISHDGNNANYEDALGRSIRFVRRSRAAFESPAGTYAVLQQETRQFILRQRYGTRRELAQPEHLGRLTAIRDRNGNSVQFAYTTENISIRDALGRVTALTLSNGLVTGLRDAAGRKWRYTYDRRSCLVEVVSSGGVSTRYGYDDSTRLVSVTDANGQTYLEVTYDHLGRTIRQRYGPQLFEFDYDTSQAVTVHSSGGRRVTIRYNDQGQPLERICLVTAEHVSSIPNGEKRVPISTQWSYNANGEWIERHGPDGDVVTRIFDVANADPRARGNLIRVVRRPAFGDTGMARALTTTCDYEPRFQRRRSITDPRGNTIRFAYDSRGNLIRRTCPAVSRFTFSASGQPRIVKRQLVERFKWNAAGQLILRTDARGGVTEYAYFAAADVMGLNRGTKGVGADGAGLIARITRNPTARGRRPVRGPTLEIRYDRFGNLASVRDANGHVTKLVHDERGRLLSVIPPTSLRQTVKFEYDSNGNPVCATVAVKCPTLDERTQSRVRSSKRNVISYTLAYDMLNRVIRRVVTSDGRSRTTTLDRDEAGNVVRLIQPMGDAVEARYDERGRRVESRNGAGTPNEAVTRHTYTLGGRRATTTNPLGQTTIFRYDGFGRLCGRTEPSGLTREYRFDGNGNITHTRVVAASAIEEKPVVLSETWRTFDQINRLMRTGRACREPQRRRAGLNDRSGILSTLIGWGDSHRAEVIAYESGNVLRFGYDLADRLVRVQDALGRSLSVTYDAAGRPVRLTRGHAAADVVINQKFDPLGRLAERAVKGRRQSFEYNELGRVIRYHDSLGTDARYLYDSFARWTGRVSRANPSRVTRDTQLTTRLTRSSMVVTQTEWDDNGRVSARVDANGQYTIYSYDGLGHPVSVTRSDGGSIRMTRDALGNVIRVETADGTVIHHMFDSANRLIRRDVTPRNDAVEAEMFGYDALGRLQHATTSAGTLKRTYDWLGRLASEEQGDLRIAYRYDRAGRRISIELADGRTVQQTFDKAGRLLTIARRRSQPLAQFDYSDAPERVSFSIGRILSVNRDYHISSRRTTVTSARVADNVLIDGWRYQRVDSSRSISETPLHAGGHGQRFGVDSLGSLVRVDGESNASVLAVTLYATGAWAEIKSSRAGGPETREAAATNALDQYVTIGKSVYEYDARGNRVVARLQNAGGQARYEYDYANRLSVVRRFDNGGHTLLEINYAYDPFGRQICKRVRERGVLREWRRLWDGRRLAQEFCNDGTSTTYTYGFADQVAWVERQAANGSRESFACCYNCRGFLTALVTEAGRLVSRIGYNAFGRPTLDDHGGPGLISAVLHVNAIWDSDASLHFVLGAPYDPDTDSFLNAGSGGGYGVASDGGTFSGPVGVGVASDGVDTAGEWAGKVTKQVGSGNFDANFGHPTYGLKDKAQELFGDKPLGARPTGDFIGRQPGDVGYDPDRSLNKAGGKLGGNTTPGGSLEDTPLGEGPEGPAGDGPPAVSPPGPVDGRTLDQVLSNSPDTYADTDPLDLLDEAPSGGEEDSGTDGGGDKGGDGEGGDGGSPDTGDGTDGDTPPSNGDAGFDPDGDDGHSDDGRHVMPGSSGQRIGGGTLPGATPAFRLPEDGYTDPAEYDVGMGFGVGDGGFRFAGGFIDPNPVDDGAGDSVSEPASFRFQGGFTDPIPDLTIFDAALGRFGIG
ncbi:MAG: DUF6531 domain-containing protein [Steroidobacteraceae bacterium]